MSEDLGYGWQGESLDLPAYLKRIGYDGYVSLEVTNPVLWEMKLTQVAEFGLMALRRVVD